MDKPTDESGDKRKRLPKFRRAPELTQAFRLSQADLEILRLAHDYRYVQAPHVSALVRRNPRHLAERLGLLFHHKYLHRLLPRQRMRVAGEVEKGSEPFTYVLDKRGAETLAKVEGVALEDLAWDPRYKTRTYDHVRHHLMVSTFRGALELALRKRRDVTLAEWRGELDIRQRFMAPGFDRKGREIKKEYGVAPDLYIAIDDGGKRRNYLTEVDAGTEDHLRLLMKFTALWWYCTPESPIHTRYKNAKDMLILVVCSTQKRLDAMRETLAAVDERGRGLRRFWFTLAGNYSLASPDAVLGPIWYVGPREANDGTRAGEEELRAIVESVERP